MRLALSFSFGEEIRETGTVAACLFGAFLHKVRPTVCFRSAFIVAVAAVSAAAPPDCATSGDGIYPNEDNCRKYYECEGGELYSFICQEVSWAQT